MCDNPTNLREFLPLDEIKSNFELKKYEHVINLTKNIYTFEGCDEYALRARYYCLIEREEFTKLVHEIMHILTRTNKENFSTKHKISNGDTGVKNKCKKTFKELFQENYECIKNKNVLFELFYCMYKLNKLKKLNGCLKYVIEQENDFHQFVDILLGEVNYRLHHFETCISSYESLLSNENPKQAIAASINVNSSYFSLYMKLLYQYNFLRKVNTKASSRKPNDNNQVKYEDIEQVKNHILTNTNNFKFDEENDSFEQLFNYSTFFIIEKNYTEATKFLDLSDAICRNSTLDDDLSDPDNLTGGHMNQIDEKTDQGMGNKMNHDNYVHEEETYANRVISLEKKNKNKTYVNLIRNKQMLIQLHRAYIYSKSNRMKDAVEIYESVLRNYEEYEQNGYAEITDNIINFIPFFVAYNNYNALRNNCEGKSIQHVSPKLKNVTSSSLQSRTSTVEQLGDPSVISFNMSPDQMHKIKTYIRMNRIGAKNSLNKHMQMVGLFNECLQSLKNEQKDEFKSKLNNFSRRFSNTVMLDKLIVLFLKKENSYIKCKHHLLKNIHLMYSYENKIKFLNAYISLCYERKSFNEIVKLYLKYEHVFKININYYRTFFSNLFYIYICARFKKKKEHSVPEDGSAPTNLNLVIDLFKKYKEIIKTDLQIVNYETLFLVSKYLLLHEKSEILIDLFEHLSKKAPNDFHFYFCFTYIYTYINMSSANKFEDKLKKAVLTETYLIDVEELENKNFPFNLTIDSGAGGGGKDPSVSISTRTDNKNKKKRKRSKKKKKAGDGKNYNPNYNPEKWLPKHEKSTFKKSKKKKQKTEELPPKHKAVVVEEEPKNQVNSSKLQNLKKRRKK
ncbi:signal recognition particle subunit SRP72 [Plasmodium gonderi]|uniref:Signal recognition particle subunit SRP72 n=1 Tax=Plasmodium gonderi TaxID=77519 RepID=A0A1Y1JF18_PLAGO|nr:signal recognition particle subunit SRP72 [Plasmodium gonderi]GAW81131.1 signal recognition particle subunit SRP72 [Plasmodium gonderi]